MKTIAFNFLVSILFCGFTTVSCSDDPVKDPVSPIEESDEESGDNPTDDEPSDKPEEKPAGSGKTYTLTPDKNGRVEIDAAKAATYKPGDIIYLRGKFKNIWFSGLKGTSAQPIRITNYPGETVTIGDPSWSGGGTGQGIRFANCHYFSAGGDKSASEFVLDGSVTGSRSSYFTIDLCEFSDNAEIKNMTIKNGGIGIMAKTNPDYNDSKTWYPNTQLNNLSIHHVRISGTADEGMYIGHTAELWGFDERGNGYTAEENVQKPGHKYVRPILWNNVKIYNNYLENIGNDGIQTAAISRLEIYKNEITKWGAGGVSYHSGGILVGGRTTNTNTHDNYVHDGAGEIFQFFGSGEGNTPHIVNNNLFVNTTSNGMGIYDEAALTITNNTIVHTDGYSMRINGRDTRVNGAHDIKNNVFIESLLKNRSQWETDLYIRTENGAKVKETGNLRYATVKDAQVDPNNSYQPLSGSKIGDKGYKKK